VIALLRLGRREAAQHRLRSSLVVALIAVPVGLGASLMVLMPQLSLGGADWTVGELGDADVKVTSDAPEPEWTPDTPISALGGPLRAQSDVVLDAATFTGWVPRGGDLVEAITVEQVDAGSPLMRERLTVAEGRAPAAPGEVAIRAADLRRLDLSIGETVELAVPEVELEVVGELDDDPARLIQAVVAPGSVERPTAPTERAPFPATWWDSAWNDVWYLGGVSPAARSAMWDLSMGVGPAESERPPSVMLSDELFAPPDDHVESRIWVIAGGAFLLLWTGLVAASGLAVGARRRKRELGLLAANGADPTRLRVAVVAEGLVLGVVGSIVGIALGLCGVYLVGPWVAERVVDGPAAWRTELSVPWLLGLGLVGVAAAVVAAASASVGVASMTPSQLLRGQRGTPRPAPAWFAGGAVLFVAGCLMLRWGRDMDVTSISGDQLRQLVIGGGVLSVTIGLVAVVVGATRLGGRLTATAPTSVRLAGRDLARHGVRIAAATAAVAVTLAGSVAFATYFDRSAAEAERSRAEGSPSGRPEPLAGGAEELGELVPRLSRLVDGRVQPLVAGADTVATLRSTGASVGTIAPLPTGPVVESGLRYCNGLGGPPEFECSPATVVVADDAMVTMLPDRVAESLREGRAVLSSGTGRLEDGSGAVVPSDAVPLQLTTLDGAYVGSSALSDTLVDAELATRLGLDPAAAVNPQVFVDLDGVGTEQRRELAAAVDDLGFDLEEGSWNASGPDPVSNAVLRTGAVAVVSLVVLLIVMITLALVRVESRSDDEVLLVAGASPGTSRRVSAARAGLIVVAAAIPASLAGWWVARSLLSGAVGVPWWAVGVGIVVLPLVAATVAAAAHRPPRRLHLG
jgi:putative ABC transport system permease protein